MGDDELQGGGGQRHAMFRAHDLDLRDLFHDLARRGRIIVFRAVLRAGGKDPRIEAAADNDRSTARFAQGQEGIQRLLFKQGIAAGQQEAVEIVADKRFVADLPFVDADTERSRSSARQAPSIACSKTSGCSLPRVKTSISWMKHMSIRSSPSRCRLSSKARIVPS
jgi:hypothetical protein